MARVTVPRLQAPKPYLERPAPVSGLLAPDRFMKLVGLVLFVAAAVLPFITATPYIISILTSAMIYIVLAMGLNVVVGYAGLLDLGYIAFMAVGAYTSGVLTTQFGLSMLETIPFVVLACIIAGVVIGGPTLRLRSDYLAIVTLGFGEIIRITANNLKITGGPSGIHGIPTWRFFGWSFADGLDIGGVHFSSKILLYYFVLFVGIGLAVVAVSRLGKGKLGRAWKSVRDDEDVSEAMGINGYTTKLAAYIIGAVWGGFAGTLMASHLSAISPNSFEFLYSALVLMAVVLGGMGSTPGVIIGALFVSLAPEFLREFSEWRFLLFGVLLVVAMIFRPKGIWPANAVLPFLKKREIPEIPPTAAVSVVGVGADYDGETDGQAAPEIAGNSNEEESGR
ncbi:MULTISPECIES: branched-chain amino acid ABC transporter permease [Leucobacter]|uniref:branched-chain amino acid ABC transporter permease n=1 Tax=Leucobacter TaxID=55968 RepID=UPI002105E91F|nr:branched-chain amino acid ABC transporter permease [Leucobacter aridicollis]UTX53032.1 branched-chain amino acid ABC transporter permease [Leucobacter aridicollis]